MELDCIPAGMEAFPAADEEQMNFIKKIIDDCDYYVLLIGGRYGSVDNSGVSYTQREYEYAVEKGIPVLAFIHSNPNSLPFENTDGADAAKIEKLNDFRDTVKAGRIVKFWEVEKELPGLVALALSRAIKTYPAVGWIRANTAADVEVLSEVNELRKENANLKAEIKNMTENETKIPNLAPISTPIEVSGTNRRYVRGEYTDFPWTIKTTFQEIFALLAPSLIANPNDTRTQSLVSEYLCTAHGVDTYKTSISTKDFDTIKVQLEALGLVSIKRAATVGGSVGVFWNLTPLGRNVMMDLRTIKTDDK